MSSLAGSIPAPRIRWHRLVLPKEHGGWSLALEPIALGLLAAPSLAGLCLAIAAIAGFLARRPLKLAWREQDFARASAAIAALVILLFTALAANIAALVVTDANWFVWLLPPALAGAVFVWFDARDAAREAAAEITGAAAFAALTPAFAAAAGWSAAASLALGFAMLARAVPTVMFVRACVRGAKTARYRAAPPLLAALAALAGAIALAASGRAPLVLPFATALLLVRAADRLLRPRRIRARTLGFQELALGAAYVALVGLGWRG
ncbi:MAG TPA: YwiC-like family protein [Opitutus sp.]|nr:YwiC-like family protein [Opitutus sp.]